MNTKTMPRGGTPARARRPEPKHAAPKAHRLDTGALLGIVLLLAVGLIALFSASYPAAISKFNDGIYFIKRQGLYAMIGFVAMLVISGIDYHIYLRFQKPLFVVCIGLLILVIIPGVGVNHNGATRWIDLPLLGEFQPSELMKDAIIISFSYYAVKFGDRVRKIRGDLPFFGALLLVAGLLYFEPHLSGTIIIFGIGLAILIVAGMKIWYFIPIGIVVAAAGVWYIATPLPPMNCSAETDGRAATARLPSVQADSGAWASDRADRSTSTCLSRKMTSSSLLGARRWDLSGRSWLSCCSPFSSTGAITSRSMRRTRWAACWPPASPPNLQFRPCLICLS